MNEDLSFFLDRTLFPLYCRKELAMMMCKLSDVDPTTRPMQLSVEDIDRLATAYKYLLEKHPELQMYDYRASRHILPTCNMRDVVIEDYVEMGEEKQIQNSHGGLHS